jgi:septal ring-binding cell division protein DamX
MDSSQDTEITLGTGKLLVLFFGLVGICALFFALGYSLGRKSEPALTTTSAAPVPQSTSGGTKASGASTAAPPMTFYKNVEQKDANADLTPAANTKTDTANAPAAPASATPASTPPASATPAATAPASTTPASTTPANPGDAAATLPSPGYFVQVAAVTKQEDADALVDALKKKQYPAFVAAASPVDKFFHVQVGPYSDIKDAEAMRTRLIGDGYSPILKR